MSHVDANIAWVTLLSPPFTQEVFEPNHDRTTAKTIRYTSASGKVVIFVRSDLLVVTNGHAQIAKHNGF